MLAPDDRRAIDGLFQRLDAVERNARDPRDPEAEELIARRIAAQPSSTYYMAQAVIVQQQALEAAEQRISELEQQTRGRGQLDRRDAYDEAPRYNPGPWERGYAGRGGGFLAGAMQTALGVTGGMLLGSMIGGLFSGSANAAEAPADTGNGGDPAGNDGSDTGGDSGDFGDSGGFDGGGMDFGGDF